MTMEWMLSATVLLLAVMLIRCLLGQKLGARLRYGLWLLVLARLLLPFSIGHSAVSPANFANRAARSQTAITTAVSESEAQLSGNAPHSEGDLSISQAPSWEAVDPAPDSVNPTTEPASPAAVQVTISWKGIWMAGMAVATLWFLFCNALFFLRLRRSRRLLGHSGRTAIYEADAPSPCLFGLLRPGIYLTPEAQADPVIRSHVLLHEKTHLRHGDPLWAFLRTICLILWWFHPLVWVAAWLSRKDCELYCDDAVIRQMGETQRIPYGRTLLMLAAQKQPVTAFCTVTTLSRSGRQLKARITAIARRVRPRVWAMILAALLALLAMGCAFAGAAESTESDAISTTQPTNQDTSREDVSDPTTDTDSDAPGDTVDPFTDADLVSPIGAMGTSLEEAQAQVSVLEFQSSEDNTQIFVCGDWTYFFRMDPTEGGYWLSGWTASGTESILDFQGAHTLTEFLDRLGVTVSDEPQLDVQLYGQKGEPLSGFISSIRKTGPIL